MAVQLKTVAVLVANPALSSILSVTLAALPSLRVRPFETETALRAYMRVAPADLVVADFDSVSAPADGLAEHLRADATIPEGLQIIALVSAVGAETRQAARAAGIDELIVKPMSPRYLVERVASRLASVRPRRPRGFYRRDWSAFGDNIVPLFRDGPSARH